MNLFKGIRSCSEYTMPCQTRSTSKTSFNASSASALTSTKYDISESKSKSKSIQRRYEARLLQLHHKHVAKVSSLIAYGTARGRTMTITSLYTISEKRRTGLASKLLHVYINDCLKKGYHTFLLDDCSEYFRQNDKNIYYKQGFRYVNDGEPEMKLSYR